MTNNLVLSNLERIIVTDIWKRLQYPDVINLLRVNKSFLPILNNPKTWCYLLDRDYPKWQHPKVDNPKEYYEICYWFGVEFSPRWSTIWLRHRRRYPDQGDKFITHKCKQIIAQQPTFPVTGMLLLRRNSDNPETILTGDNIYDLIFKAIKIVYSNTVQSLITFFDSYTERSDTSFKQVLDKIITGWIDNKEPFVVIISNKDRNVLCDYSACNYINGS